MIRLQLYTVNKPTIHLNIHTNYIYTLVVSKTLYLMP